MRPRLAGPRAEAELGGLAGTREDERVFRAWYDTALPRVYAYLFHRCGRDREVAEELTQQTFVKAVHTHWPDGSDDDLVAWVVGIARHTLADHFRALERRERGFHRLSVRAAATVTWIGDESDEGRVVAALRRLPAAQRAAVTLRYVDDLPVREVGRLLGRSEGAVESLLSRGRETLRQIAGTER